MHALHAEKMDTAESRVCAATGQNGFRGVDHGVRAIALRSGLLSETTIFQFGQPLVRQRDSGRCLLYTSPSPRDGLLSRMPSSA